MGKSTDLKSHEKDNILKLIAGGKTTLEVSKLLKRDHRTIKKHVAGCFSRKGRKDRGKYRKVSPREVRKLKVCVNKNPLSTSKFIFADSDIVNVSRDTRCRILRQVASVRKVTKRPLLKQSHLKDRIKWAEKHMKTNFENVIFSDECRASLDGPDGFGKGWISKKSDVHLYNRFKRQQGGGGVMFWGAIHGNNLIGPHRIPDGQKIDSKQYIDMIKAKLFPYINSYSAKDRKKLIFMHDNAPTHVSNETKNFFKQNLGTVKNILQWPAVSPDINPIENVWGVIKSDLYSCGKQYMSNDELWRAILKAFSNLSSTTIKSLTGSMDKRISLLLQNKGHYINH